MQSWFPKLPSCPHQTPVKLLMARAQTVQNPIRKTLGPQGWVLSQLFAAAMPFSPAPRGLCSMLHTNCLFSLGRQFQRIRREKCQVVDSNNRFFTIVSIFPTVCAEASRDPLSLSACWVSIDPDPGPPIYRSSQPPRLQSKLLRRLHLEVSSSWLPSCFFTGSSPTNRSQPWATPATGRPSCPPRGLPSIVCPVLTLKSMKNKS